MAKIWKKDRLNRYIDTDAFDGPVDEVIARLQEWREFHEKEGYRNITVSVEQNYDYTEVDLYGERLETDKEEVARLKRSDAAKKAAKVRKDKKKEKELKELERLKKKYDGSRGS